MVFSFVYSYVHIWDTMNTNLAAHRDTHAHTQKDMEICFNAETRRWVFWEVITQKKKKNERGALRLLAWTSCRIYLKLLYSDRVIALRRHAHRHLLVPHTHTHTHMYTHTHTHTPIIVIYFSLWSVCVQAGCNQRGQTANGSVTFWLSNALWPI